MASRLGLPGPAYRARRSGRRAFRSSHTVPTSSTVRRSNDPAGRRRTHGTLAGRRTGVPDASFSQTGTTPGGRGPCAEDSAAAWRSGGAGQRARRHGKHIGKVSVRLRLDSFPVRSPPGGGSRRRRSRRDVCGSAPQPGLRALAGVTGRDGPPEEPADHPGRPRSTGHRHGRVIPE
jgi:hypothetical protein